MKNFYLNFHFDKADGKTIQFLEELEELEESFICNTEEGLLHPVIDEPIATIYVDCTGGENRMAAILYNFFKTSNYKYNFVVNGDFSSNAIILLLALNPEHFTIMRQCIAIIHLSNYNHPVSSIMLNDEKHHTLNDYNDFKDYLRNLMDLYKLFLSKEELKTIKIGGDVMISSKRVMELFLKLKKSKVLQQKAKNIFEITL